jgi:hypothetical protein
MADLDREAAIKLMFDDCIGTIKFGKSQMWDTFKWSMTLQFTFLGLSLLKLGKMGEISSIVPIFIGAVAYWIVSRHAADLDRSREYLELIRAEIGGVMLDVFKPDPTRVNRKKSYSNAYLNGISITSFGCFLLILLNSIYFSNGAT